MPPKKAPVTGTKPGNRSYDFHTMSFSAEIVACLLVGRSITTEQYNMMSSLDGTRTATALQHQFRAPLRRAKEIQSMQEEMIKEGKKWEGVKPGMKRTAEASTEPSPKKPRTSTTTQLVDKKEKGMQGKKGNEKSDDDDSEGHIVKTERQEGFGPYEL